MYKKKTGNGIRKLHVQTFEFSGPKALQEL